MELHEVFVVEIEECAETSDKYEFRTLLCVVIKLMFCGAPDFFRCRAGPVDVGAKSIANSERSIVFGLGDHCCRSNAQSRDAIENTLQYGFTEYIEQRDGHSGDPF